MEERSIQCHNPLCTAWAQQYHWWGMKFCCQECIEDLQYAVAHLRVIDCGQCSERFLVDERHIKHFSKCNYNIITGCTAGCVKEKEDV